MSQRRHEAIDPLSLRRVTGRGNPLTDWAQPTYGGPNHCHLPPPFNISDPACGVHNRAFIQSQQQGNNWFQAWWQTRRLFWPAAGAVARHLVGR